MKKLSKVLLFFVLVLSIVLASCNKKVEGSLTLNYGFDIETKKVNAEEFDKDLLVAQKDGYKLVGWYLDSNYSTVYVSADKIIGDVIIYAKWVAVDYLINYHLDGGTNNSANPSSYTIEDNITLADATKEGYSFVGWYASETSNEKVTSIAKGTTKDIDLYAKWTEEVLVRFVVDNDVVKTVNVSKGEQIVIPTAPAKEGYTFDNWYLGNDVYEVAETTESITVVGRYNINSYDVKYYVDNNELNSEKVYYNNKVNGLDNNPSKTGYEFKGWYSDSNFTTLFNVQEDRITSDTNLYAKFEPISYEITYEADGGLIAATNPRKYTIEDEKTLVDSNKPGYKFLGWYSDAKYQNKVTKIEKGTTGNITLYAKFGIVNYLITYELNGGSNSANNPASYNVETETIVFANATKAGYDFKGWYGDKEFLYELNKIEKGSLDINIKLYAKFEPTKYEITYNLDGGTNSANNPVTYTIEDEIVLADAEKEGYDFTGWLNAEGAPVTKIEKGTTGAKSLTATFKAKEYTVTFYLGEDVFTTVKVNYNNAVGELEANPSKTGYSFAGWYKETTFVNRIADLTKEVINSNTSFYGRFVAFDYPISYEHYYWIVGDIDFKNNPTTYTVEDEITLVDPELEGYVFKGWLTRTGNPTEGYIAKGTTGQIVLIADFEPLEFDVTYYNGDIKLGSEKVKANEHLVGLGENPSKAGYEFKGWFKDSQFKNAFNIETDYATADTNLYAKLEIIEYEITYELLDDETNSANNPTKYTVETATITLSPATKEGYKFTGWYSDAKYQNKVEAITKGSTGNLKLYGLFEGIVSLVFKVDGTNYKVINITEGETIELPEAPKKTGYDFDNWYLETGALFDINEPITQTTYVIAAFVKQQYTVTFYLGDDVFTTVKVDYEGTVGELDSNPKKTGYSFAGWYKEATFVNRIADLTKEVISSNTNFYGRFVAFDYPISYEYYYWIVGDIDFKNNPTTYTVEDEITLVDPELEGYVFKGWLTRAGNPTEGYIPKGTTGQIRLIADFEPIEYDVTYYDGKNILGTEKVKFNEYALGLDEDPVKAGYEFKDWYKDTDLKTLFDFDTEVIKANTAIYAKFDVVEYTITYELDGGTNSESNPAKYTIEDEIVFAPATKEGYELVGWYSDQKYQNKVEKIEKGTTGNLTLYALYDVAKYTVTIYGNGGSLTSNSENVVIEDVLYNTQFKELSPLLNSYGFTPAKEGYRLAAFAYSATGDPIPTDELNAIVIKADLELYAYWAKQYKIRLNYLNDYKETIYDSFNCKTFPASILENVNLDGYNIIGWLDEDGKDFDLNTPFDRDFVLTAKVTPIEYTITYELDGGTNSESNPSTYTIETETITLANASKEGHKFIDWYSDAKYQNKVEKIEKGTFGDITLYVLFEIETYKVTYIVDGNSVSTEYVVYGNYALGINAPSKTGYEFAGWYIDEAYKTEFDLKSDVIKGETNLYAKFEPKKYSITYDANGGKFGTESSMVIENVSYGTTLGDALYNAKAIPTKSGYSRIGFKIGNNTIENSQMDTFIIEGNITISQIWYMDVYDVYYYNLDGATNSLKNPDTFTVEELPIALEPATKDHYDFVGWYLDLEDSTTKVETIDVALMDSLTSGNLDLYAKFEPKTLTITYVLEDGAVNDPTNPTTYKAFEVVSFKPATKEGYKFIGWYFNLNDPEDEYVEFTFYDCEDLVLYAKFEKEKTNINVTECVGANEVIYLKLDIVNDYAINDYKVSYLLNNNYVQINSQLVRFIDEDSDGTNDYVRADVLGLAAGNYNVKVELGEESVIKNNILVSSQDRSGYAHNNYTDGVGAYNDDGTLKDDTEIIYVTDANKNDITVNGYKGLVNILTNLQEFKTPVVIRFLDLVKTTQWNVKTYQSYSESAIIESYKNAKVTDDKFYYAADLIKADANSYSDDLAAGITTLENLVSYGTSSDSYWNMCDIQNANNVTLEGVGLNAGLYQWGISWKSCTSIEVRNLVFKDYTEDACAFEGSTNSASLGDYAKVGRYWVHNNSFYIGKNNWDVSDDQDKKEGDGATDFKRTGNITVSYNLYVENHKTGLVGSDDTVYTANVTFHHNFYYANQSRMPLGRNANMHMYNNYYYGTTGTNMSIRSRGYAFVENCLFENCKNPVETKAGGKTGFTGYTGAVKSYNNSFVNCTGANNATVVTSRTDTVTNDNSYGQTFDTDPTIFYYDSAAQKSNVSIMQDVSDVKAYVTLHAGAGAGYYLTLELYPLTKYDVTLKYVVNSQVRDYGTVKAIEDTPISAPSFNVRGFELVDWYADEELLTKFDFTTPITKDTTIYAKVNALEAFVVDYIYNVGDGDVAISSTTVYDGEKVAKPSDPKLSGYLFKGWYTSLSYEAEFDFATAITKATTIYAKFEEYTPAASYSISFNDGVPTGVELISGASLADASNVQCGDFVATKYLNFSGGGSRTSKAMSFVISKTSNITAYFSGKDGETRNLKLDGDNLDSAKLAPITSTNVGSYTYENIPAGTYYLYSAGSGIKVYYIVVSEVSSQNPDPIDYEDMELCYYYTARNMDKNTSYNNGQYPSHHVKTIYKVGEQFDSSYLSAIVNNQYITTGFTFSGFDSSTTGKKTITVTYSNYQATFDVYVLAADFEVASDDTGYYAIVGSNFEVGEDFKSGNTTFTTFKTINQALEALEMVTPTATKRANLQISAGYYNEKVVINVPYLTITGSGYAKATYENDESYDATDLARATVIEWNSLYGMTTEGNGVTDKTHQTSYQVTDSTQTVYITEKAINCEIEQLTISNWWNNEERFNSKYNELKDIYYHDYDKDKDVYLASNNKITEHRALALLVQADMVILNTVSLLGYQDTVEFFTGRHFLTNCYITGATDYIFGTNGTTYIANSVIHTIYNGRSDQGGYVNAFKGQNASASDSIQYGCIYDGCTFEADSNVANGIIALGRPWTTSSNVMIMNSTISAKYSTTPTASSSVGRYCNWNSNILASDAKFYEYNNQGLGAIDSSITGCTVLTDATEAAKYNNSEIIFGTTNGNVKYDNAWDGTTKPIVDTKVYYYFDGTATSNGYTFTADDNVNGTTGTFGNMTIDATNGKLEARSNDTQMNAGTIITLTVTKASTITITFNHWQEAYTVNGVASTSGVYTIQLAAGETFTFVATATSYLKSIVIS